MTARKAWKIFFHDSFDVVLIDGLLPKKSGFEVVPLIREMPRGKDVGIIMMTAAFKTPQARKEAFEVRPGKAGPQGRRWRSSLEMRNRCPAGANPARSQPSRADR